MNYYCQLFVKNKYYKKLIYCPKNTVANEILERKYMNYFFIARHGYLTRIYSREQESSNFEFFSSKNTSENKKQNVLGAENPLCRDQNHRSGMPKSSRCSPSLCYSPCYNITRFNTKIMKKTKLFPSRAS